jgi:hypothetical protein
MVNSYNVLYYLGKNQNTVYKLWIAAHNEIDARSYLIMQAGRRHGGRAKPTVISIEDAEDNDWREQAKDERP